MQSWLEDEYWLKDVREDGLVSTLCAVRAWSTGLVLCACCWAASSPSWALLGCWIRRIFAFHEKR